MLGLGLSIPQVAARGSRSLVAAIRSLFAANDPGVWYDPSDLSTLFQDSAGTTPVTAVEQPVGLMLDKSKGLVLGSELVTNGDFSSGTTGWTVPAGWSISGGVATGSNVTDAIRNAGGQQLVAGKRYQISITVTSYTSGTLFYPYSGSGGIAISGLGLGTFTYRFNAPNTDFCYVYGFGFTGSIDNISVRELPGNHAYQSTATSRPVLSARVNLLTKTEDLSDAAWIKQLCSISPNLITAPDGTLTADKVVEDTTSAVHRIEQNVTVVDGVSYTISVAAKKAERSFLQLFEDTAGRGAAVFDLATGVVSSVVSGTAAIKDLGNGWFRCSVTYVQSGTTCRFRIAPQAGATPGAYLGDGTSGIYIWGADLRVANDGANLPPYQRVNTATDYDTMGFPHYLRFDGVDDWLVTNTITPGTDKVQVFAGVRKLSDVIGAIAELSYVWTNSGAFAIFDSASDAASGRTLGMGVGPDALVSVPEVLSPTTYVATGSISRDSGAATLRRNSTTVGSISTAGPGNFGNYPLYIGRRGGTTFPFNGHLYGLIVRFGANLPIETIEKTEKYINQKTRAY